MNILLSVNQAFFEAAKITMYSLYKNNSWTCVHVYLFHNELKEEHIKELEQISKKFFGKFTPIWIDDNELKGVPVAALSKETYYRLFAPSILPEEVDKILYLDVDILVMGSLKKLYETNLTGYYFAAAQDTSMGVDKFKKELEIPEKYTYINAGILLMNIKELRRELNLKEALDFARVFPRKVPNCDQDVINGLYYSKIKYVDTCFNYEARYHSAEDWLLFPFRYMKSRILHDIKIVHYMGKNKPWRESYNGKFADEYYKAAKEAGIELSYKQSKMKTAWNGLKYLLETGYF